MFIYADPRACPGCRSQLPSPALSCPACGLVLTGSGPRRVFEMLSRVDGLVADLYGQTPTTAPPPPPAAVPPPPPPRPTITAASVPKILLGLGALCLLVAGIVFLAVAWASLGVGGRTAVLALITLVAAASTRWVVGRELRGGAEALASVALGLLPLDLYGAWRAGWLGALDDGWFLVVTGVVVALAGAAAARWAATTAVGALFSAELIAALGVLGAALGVMDVLERSAAVAVLASLLVCATVTALGWRLGLRVLAGAGAGLTALCWLALTAVGLLRLEPLTVAHLWGDLAVWPLLVATAGVAGVAVPGRLPLGARVPAAATAVLLATLALTAATFDESPTRVALVELAVVAAYALLATRLPSPWRWLGAAPSLVAALGLALGVARLAVTSMTTLVLHQPWTLDALDRLVGPDVPWTWPLLLPAGTAGVAVTVATLVHCAGARPRSVLVPGAGGTLVALALMVPLYDVPLGVAVGVLLLVAGLLGLAGVRLCRDGLVVTAVGGAGLALAAALANDWLTAGVLAVLTVVAVAAEVLGPRRLHDVGALLAPLTGAGLLWTLGHLAGMETAWRALPVLVVLGLAVILAPALLREVAAAVAMVAAASSSVLAGGEPDQAWLAIYLTVAGVVATASSLVNPDRRRLAWVGLACLTLAQWVRLQQLGVGTVEAYTLPLALVLLAVGALGLRRGTGSSLRLLGPGLILAVLPTLLQVLADPIGVRAMLLGAACLALVAAGVALRWAAPLLAGAGAGALVVLRQGTLAEILPQWVLIGLIGLALTVTGITWEQRLRELRRVSAYVRALR